MTGTNKVEIIQKLQPGDMGEWMTKVVNTQNQVAALLDKVHNCFIALPCDAPERKQKLKGPPHLRKV